MTTSTAGIHHITSFVRDPQINVDFYAGILGLRLVKKTINFDAPEVYHLYFGDQMGHPGTAITFFPSPGSRQGRIGGGQVGVTTFAVPPGALPFWEERLGKLGVAVERIGRFGETYLRFADRDGLKLEIVEREEGPLSEWSFGGVPADKAIKGFGGAVLNSVRPDQTVNVLENVLGLKKIAAEGGLIRFRAAGDLGNVIDIGAEPVQWGAGGAGTVHHIAWRAKDDQDHAQWRERVLAAGLQPTPFVNRQYFNAIYFREPGGILFEIATDEPGFAVDEPFAALGEKLMLPEWYEKHRDAIRAELAADRGSRAGGDGGMKHLFQQGADERAPTLLLLHGTGGTERDLVPLAGRLAPGASLLGVRGNVLENGMPRFFRRLAEGVFDEADLVLRTRELNEFVDEAAQRYGFERKRVVALGYSNGANVAASLLFHHPGSLAGAMLHHPMVPRRGVELPDLTGVPVFIGAGTNDPICSPEETRELQTLLAGAGAQTDVRWFPYGHQLTGEEAAAATSWYRERWGAE